MPTHVALLRGINVGGRNRVAMADLREVVLGLGHTEVATYIQSGNVVFTSEEADTARIAAALERAIAKYLGVRPTVNRRSFLWLDQRTAGVSAPLRCVGVRRINRRPVDWASSVGP